MDQKITSYHEVDPEGNPGGGNTKGVGISINWQDGPLGRGVDRKEPNGAFVEGVIKAALGRLKFYESSKFACMENLAAIEALEVALSWCNLRTKARERKGIEGTHNV